MRIIFFGTPDYVLPILSALHKKYNSGRIRHLVAVVTQEPKPSGRNKYITRSAVDTWAYKHKIEVVFDFENIPDFDLGVVASYGKIIPEDVIQKAKYGILNVHPSLLPKWRGASPVQAAIVTGNTQTGVSVIKMDALMDHGEIVSSFKEEILKTDTTESLRNRLFERSVQFLIDLIPEYLDGKIKLKEQNHGEATFTKQISKAHAFIPPEFIVQALNGEKTKQDINWEIQFIKDCSLPPTRLVLDNFIRAMNPWPIAWTYVVLDSEAKNSRASEQEVPKRSQIRAELFNRQIKRLKILRAHVEQSRLVLDDVQLEGKKPVSWGQFRQGYPQLKLGG